MTNALFLVSGDRWSASARAFVLAARGLAARGHDVALACETDCPVHVHAQAAELPVIALQPKSSATGEGWRLRETVRDRGIHAVFVHTDAELFTASSAVRFARGGGRVIRRIPPFTAVPRTRRAGMAARIAPAGLLFTTEADRDAATGVERFRIPPAVAPLAVDPESYASITPATRETLRAPAKARLIVCIQDGEHPQQVFTAIRTLSLLAPRHPELHLVVIGPGSMDEMRMHGAALGVNAMVSYLEHRDDALAIIRAADVGWIAAAGDAAAFAALDCMASGVPVVVERSPLAEHYVADGIAGILLASPDATVTAASVAAFLAKGDLRAQMGQAGRVRLQREFPYEAMLRGYEQAMGGAVGAAAAAAR